MAHTYGEVLPPSFPDIFSSAGDPQQTVFIDAGSGYGALLAAAVSVYGCSHAIGVEKYKDKYLASLELVGQMPPALQQRVTVVLQDINDTDLMPLLESLSFQTVLFFCNNVAFNSGTIHRLGVKVRSFLDELQAADRKCIVISMMPLTQLTTNKISTLALHTTWNKEEPHATPVYSSFPLT
ncbi:TPA: hypothetical protein ACH3X2_005984 [Trebouxia sp. C0005]|nr:MAG: hypothetical protein FRX49_00684 [Trebouxia sp. A1-2]